MKKYIIDYIGGRLDITDSNGYEELKYYAYAEYFGMTNDDLFSLQNYLNENYSMILGLSRAYNYFGDGE